MGGYCNRLGPECLVAGVAHELNNPISFILGNTHAFESYSRRLQHFFTELDKIDTPHIRTLRKQARIDKLLVDLDPLVEGTNEGAQRVSDIVGNLLRFTTPQQRNAESYDLVHLVNTAVQWVLRASTLKPTLHLDLPPELMIHGQEGLAHQILVNLLHNAIDACESTDSPTLWIKLEYDAEQVSIHIRDNGIGIKPSHLNTIFDPFFTTKESGKGTGLGLYISYLLATEQCGGALTAENHPEGGALFCLSLPLTIHDMTVEVQDD
jgi:two-component system sensor histidine kinase HupT/HoxJ